MAGGDTVGVLPVGGPGNVDLGLVLGDAVEELAGVVVFGEVVQASRSVDGVEMRAIEFSHLEGISQQLC